MPVERITALKTDGAHIETASSEAGAQSVAMRTESPSEGEKGLSPVVRAPGTGQVGERESLENAWGLQLEEEEEEEEPGDEVMDEGLEMKEENQRDPGEVVIISDSEEEEVVILHPKTQVKDSKVHTSSSKKQRKEKPVH
ncbi:hypothetical protein SKAU_G00387970 [Synaphobranchus kaupii]|uniref:Uncharacterized protein n=1 Tax=Synaphobranchus kaupii TaxID=118154 RepID=A0A9Q1EAZ5_SYNKA|nr:hypothetical protein SKAU_G00387970 [Synaphobranchus kaupii]